MNRSDKRQILFVILILSFLNTFSQDNVFKNKFSELFNCTIVPKTNINFKEYYEITILQATDHSNPTSKFNQRIYIGFQDFNAPTVIVTDGYAIDYASKPDYSNELAKELKANIVIVEHRFFGKSVPDSIDWKLLTMKQAADDCHFIKSILDKILIGKWLSTGISKGGQAALSYKMFYPKDVAATVVYGTAIKSKQTIFTDSLLYSLSQTECGRKICELQYYLFRHKNTLLPCLNDFATQKKIDFSPLENETVLDYLLLELPFSYWQNGNKCEETPDTTQSSVNLTGYLIKIVPPRFFSVTNKIQLEPAFYMFYHELGYYEYDIEPFIKYLKQKNYTNTYFAPKNITIQFDNTFHKSIHSFITSNDSKNVFFINGQNDPWALQTSTTKNVYTVTSGSHKSRINDFAPRQKATIYNKIRRCIN